MLGFGLYPVQNAKYLVIGSDGIEAKKLKQRKPDQIFEMCIRRSDDASTLIIQFETPTKRKKELTNIETNLTCKRALS